MKMPTSVEDFSHILDLAALSQFQSIFYKLTGLPVSLCNSELATITFYPKTERSSLCKVIQTSKEGVERCRSSDEAAIDKSLKKKRPYIYRCHAGLINVTIPLIIDGRHVGSLMSGQILTTPLSPDYTEEIKANLRDLPVKEGALKKAIEKLEVVSEEHLRVASQFLSLMATYIVEAEIRNALSKAAQVETSETLEERLKRSMPFGSPLNLEGRKAVEDGSAVEQAIKFIGKRLDEPLNLSRVADEVHLSPTYFARLFKKEMGLTFHDYLTQLRIREAARLLKDTSLPISEISIRVGYKDPNYFSQVFRRVMKTTPTDFRNVGILKF
jgi:AraC-like DNA-binding protein/ligand-binding sensor protein